MWKWSKLMPASLQVLRFMGKMRGGYEGWRPAKSRQRHESYIAEGGERHESPKGRRLPWIPRRHPLYPGERKPLPDAHAAAPDRLTSCRSLR